MIIRHNYQHAYYVLYTAYGKKWQAGPYEEYVDAEKHVRALRRYPEVTTIAITLETDKSRVAVGPR